jgi:hypothetical protein
MTDAALIGERQPATHYLMLGILIDFSRTPVPAATTVGFANGAVTNYIVNK